VRGDFVNAALAIELRQFRNLLPVDLRRGKPQLLLKSPLQRRDISVFAEDERHNQPIIPCADLAIFAQVSEELPLFPPRDIRGSPAEFASFFAKGGSLVFHVPARKKRAAADRLYRFSYNDSVHLHEGATLEVLDGKLVFCRDIALQNIGFGVEENLFAFSQIGERDQNIVMGIEFENLMRHIRKSKAFLQFCESHRW